MNEFLLHYKSDLMANVKEPYFFSSVFFSEGFMLTEKDLVLSSTSGLPLFIFFLDIHKCNYLN